MKVIETLRGGLIVSCQAPEGSPLDRPEIIAAFALAAERSGACGVRINRPDNISAVQAATRLPIIGIYKQRSEGQPVYITPNGEAARQVAEAGADLIALDATARRAGGYGEVRQLISEIGARLALPVMADVATEEDARQAEQAGAALVATTLFGYTDETRGAALPNLDLVRLLAATLRIPVVCEGGVQSPEQVAAAFEAGAWAVVVGTALTGIEARVRLFAAAAQAYRTGGR